MQKYKVSLWYGFGPVFKDYEICADSEQQALESAVVQAENENKNVFYDNCKELSEWIDMGLVLKVGSHYVSATRTTVRKE